MKIALKSPSLIVLVGLSGIGKSTFARKHFAATEILSSDAFRAMVCNDENNQSISGHAFELLHLALTKRLMLGKLTVVDATNLKADSRKALLKIADVHKVPTVAIVFDLPETVARQRNQQRVGRVVPGEVITRHTEQLRQTLRQLPLEFPEVHILHTIEEMEAVTFERPAEAHLRPELHGPFDIVGDIHGCIDELRELLEKIGYRLQKENGTYSLSHPDNRRLLFVGDLVDRGPNTPEVIRIVRDLNRAGQAWCVRGNHDDKLFRKLSGRKVQISHGLETSLNQLANDLPEFTAEATEFLGSLPYQLVLDDGKLVIAHAGLKEQFIGRSSDQIRSFALYGDTTGETDSDGLPVRLNWAADYRGPAQIIYGHTPIAEPQWVNNTINIDTGCVFGGQLTALRYPEGDWVSVSARREYAPSKRNFKVLATIASAPPSTEPHG